MVLAANYVRTRLSYRELGCYAFLPSVPFLAIVLAIAAHAGLARGQGYGSDLQNIMGPASGGMAGVSVAEPQDVPSAIFGNPATLAQFEGTQFTIGGGWIEGYPTVTYDGKGSPLLGSAVQRHVADPGLHGHRDRRGPGSPHPRTGRYPGNRTWPASAAAGPNIGARPRET